jgi:hypothetical protein
LRFLRLCRMRGECEGGCQKKDAYAGHGLCGEGQERGASGGDATCRSKNMVVK